jgi:hypothetical protein
MTLQRNQLAVKCAACGSDAVLEVVPDGWDDAPKTFVVTHTCSGRCEKLYDPITAEEMHRRTGLPMTGWPIW